MWLWETERNPDLPMDERERSVIQDVRTLRAWFQEQRTESYFGGRVIGYGRAFVRPLGGAFPVLVFDGDRTHFDSLTPRPEPVQGPGLPQTKLALYALYMPTPVPARFELSADPPIVPHGLAIAKAGTSAYGSVGATVQLKDGSLGIVTAGHVFPDGEDTKVERLRRWGPLVLTRHYFGQVEHHKAPTAGGTAEWDVAVVRTTGALRGRSNVSVRHPTNSIVHEEVCTTGARSGRVDGIEVFGALEEVRTELLSWKCCWAAGPVRSLRRGDSGAAVFTEASNELIGVFVGRSRNRRGEIVGMFIQDAYSIQDNVFKTWGVTF